jgi:hypothetical protein
MTRLWVARTQGMQCYVYVYLWLIFVLRGVGQPVGSSCITNYECARNAARTFFLFVKEKPRQCPCSLCHLVTDFCTIRLMPSVNIIVFFPPNLHMRAIVWEIILHLYGCVIAEAVSRWFPTATAQVRGQVWQVGFVVDKVASGQVFSEYFGFPFQNHSFHHHHHHNHIREK